MYEPYVPPGGPAAEPACVCATDGVPCAADCERCRVDCPERIAAAPYEPYDEPSGAEPVVTSAPAARRRRRTSSARSSTWRSRSSTRSSGSSSRKSSGGKKAGAGLGAAATAAAGGIGALSSGGEDPAADSPAPGYPEYSNHAGYDDYDDPQAVADRVTVPIMSFRAQHNGRLVVVTGAWTGSDLPGGCRVEVTVTERAHRVVLEASAPVTRWQLQQGETCDPPSTWSSGTSYVLLDEPLGERTVVTSGPLLRDGDEVDPAGAARVPRG